MVLNLTGKEINSTERDALDRVAQKEESQFTTSYYRSNGNYTLNCIRDQTQLL